MRAKYDHIDIFPVSQFLDGKSCTFILNNTSFTRHRQSHFYLIQVLIHSQCG